MPSLDRRQAVKDLLEAAFHYKPASRADFIRGASHGDEALSDAALRVLETIAAKRAVWGTGAPSEADLLDEVLDSTEYSDAQYQDTPESPEFRGTSRFELRRRLG